MMAAASRDAAPRWSWRVQTACMHTIATTLVVLGFFVCRLTLNALMLGDETRTWQHVPDILPRLVSA